MSDNDKTPPGATPVSGAFVNVPWMGADGKMMQFSFGNYVFESLRSALVIQPWNDDLREEWELFSYERGHPVPGTIGPEAVRASSIHTNVPRSGSVGLPRDWEMKVHEWRATVSCPLEQPVLDWAAETSVKFRYNETLWGDAVLADLLFGSKSLSKNVEERLASVKRPETLEDAQKIIDAQEGNYIWMRTGPNYRVDVETRNQAVLKQLRQWLKGSAPDNVRDAYTELDVISRFVSGPTAESIKSVLAKLQPGRSLTCWVHLDGVMKKSVVGG